MRSTLFTIIAALLVGCATTPDPIDRLVASL
jgi:starvation-inducible outer membrane lipoprotein